MKIIVNGQQRDVHEGITIAALLKEMEITVRHLAVEVNLELVPRTRHGEYQLHDRDSLEVVTLVGGG